MQMHFNLPECASKILARCGKLYPRIITTRSKETWRCLQCDWHSFSVFSLYLCSAQGPLFNYAVICYQYLINKTNLVRNLFLVYLSISTCFGRLCAHHQEKQLYLCDTLYSHPYRVKSSKFNVLLTVHHAMILGNFPNWCTKSFQCIYLFIVLYMFRACHAHHQEKQIVSIQLLVIVTL